MKYKKSPIKHLYSRAFYGKTKYKKPQSKMSVRVRSMAKKRHKKSPIKNFGSSELRLSLYSQYNMFPFPFKLDGI